MELKNIDAKPMMASIIGKLKQIKPMFLAVVVGPTLLSTIYFGLIASDVYISESQFVVRSPKSQSSVTGIGALLQSAGFSRSADDTYTVHAYLRSRDALFGLNQNDDVSRHYHSSNIDWLNRYNLFNFKDGVEDLYQYFQNKLTLDLDIASSITTLKMRAYTPEQAQQFNESLLQQGEILINKLNERGRKDVIGYAQNELNEAQQTVIRTGKALNEYRIQNSIYDIKAQADIQSKLIGQLQNEQISIRTQLAQIQALTPDNPQIPALRARAKGLQAEISKEMAKILGAESGSITNQAAEYEKLKIENMLAEQKLASAVTNLDAANSEAQKKQLYLERIVQPNKPDEALEPQRLHNILSTLIISLIAYGILKLLIASAKEHQD